MLDFPKWKIWLVMAFTVTGMIFALPSLLPKAAISWLPQRLQDTRVNLGLDLAGGSELLLEATTDDVAKIRMERMEEAVRTDLRRGDPKIEVGDISTAGGVLSFMPRNTAEVDKARERVYNLTTGIGITGQRDWNVDIRDSTRIVMTPTAAGLSDEINKAMETARDVVRRRIDPDGTKEVSVTRQGANRIQVQVPGLKDPEGLKSLLGKTAKLEFKLVDETADPATLAQGVAPPGSQVLAYPDNPSGVPFIAVKRRLMVSGDELNDASQGFDQQSNAPVVNIRFNSQGGKKFGRTTTENVQKPFAIILDNVVISAPNINEPILGGSAQISGNFTVKSANELAISLRSGKLPVALKVVDERSVGPDLGRESIDSGIKAGIAATLALIVYMLLTYLRFGVYTTVALLVNGVLILGLMAVFGGTLTLPGIAGFVLTIGAAVDANVLINERIREEIARGRQTIQAVEFGYKEASSAIFDANITNVISAVIMFWFGSGPIRGFAVVLTLGIVTSVFTGVTLTRLMVSLYLQSNRPRELII
jgi:preprotein translocase subunit SecD